MAVRFLPVEPEKRSGDTGRENLAEIIELRSRLQRVPAAGTDEAAIDRCAPADVDSPEELERASGPELREDAVRLLARKARSSGELRRELRAREHDPLEVETLLEEFIENHYLDDRGLARATVESLRERKRASRQQIRMKLRERDFADDIIEEALGELDEDVELELLQSTADERARRLVGLERSVAERRLLGYLARRGWSGSHAYTAARDAIDRLETGGPGSVKFR